MSCATERVVFDDATAFDVRAVAARMRAKDYEEIICQTPCQDRIALAEFMPMALQSCFNRVARLDDVPVVILSWGPVLPGVWRIGMFATDEFPRVSKAVTRYVAKVLAPTLLEAGAHRIECLSIAGYDEVHDWLRYLGMTEEGPVRKLGRNREDFVMFSWVEGDGWGRKDR